MTTVFIISAPSGSGKSTLVSRLLASVPAYVLRLLHHPQAARRTRWTAQSYHFVAREEFEAMIARGEFLEWAEVFGNYYGTHRGILEAGPGPGQGPGTRHRRARCETIEEQIPEAVTVFILAPSRQILEQTASRARRGPGRSDRAAAAGSGRGDPELQRVRLCADQSRPGRVRRRSERHRARRAGPADQDRRPDPADSGDISG